MNHRAIIGCLLLPLAVHTSVFAQDALDKIEQVGMQRTKEGQAAQSRIDDIAAGNRELVDEYHAQLKLVDNLET